AAPAPPAPSAAPAAKASPPPRPAAPPARPKPAAPPPLDDLLDLSEEDASPARPDKAAAKQDGAGGKHGAGSPDFASTKARTVLPVQEEPEEESDDLEMLREALSEPDAEKLGEVDFYVEQGLVDEARQVLFQLKKRFPGSPAVEERIARLETPAAAPGAG